MKFVVYFCCTVLIIVLGLLVLPSVIDWNVRYGPYIFKQLNTINKNVKVVGEISGSFIFPKIIIRNLYMESESDLSEKVIVSVDKLELGISFMSLISLAPKIKFIKAYGLKSTVDGLISAMMLKEQNDIQFISITDSVINIVTDNSSSRTKAVTIYDGTVKSSKGRVTANALLHIGRNKYQLTSSMNMNKKGNVSKASLAIESQVTKLKLLSNDTGDVDKFSGVLTIESSNFAELINDISEINKTSMFPFITSQENFSLYANVSVGDSKLNFSNIKISSKSVEGNADVQCNNYSSCVTNINFTKINIDSLISGNSEIDYEYEKSSRALDYFSIFVSDTFQVKVNLAVKDLKFNDKMVHDLLMNIIILNGKISVERLQAKLPGINNMLYIQGDAVNSNVVSKFHGIIKVYGDDLDVLVKWLMPVDMYGEYKSNKFILNSNLYIAPRIFSFTNIKFVTNNVGSIQGDFRIKYDRNKGNFIGNINVKDFNCNYYKLTKKVNFEEDVMSFKWLKKLGYRVKINFQLSDILLNESIIKKLSFFANIASKKMSIERIQFADEYGSNLQGFMRAIISSHDVRPKILLRLRGEKYDSNFIKLPKIINTLVDNDKKVQQMKWSNNRIRFFGLGNSDGNIDINIQKVIFKKSIINDFQFSSDIRDGLMSIKKLKFVIDEGSVEFNGNVGMGDIPSLSAVLSISNIQLQHIARGLNITGVQGNVSISGSVKTQGNNLVEWMNALDGKVEFAARGVDISDINFNLFIKNLFMARSKSDIASLVKVSLYSDSTLFSMINGKSDIKKGTASSSIEFKIDNAVGVMSANFSFVNFSIVSLCKFFFIPSGALSSVSIDMDLQGYIWQPKMTFNIDSLYDLAHKYAS
ncbi:AsmA family protein [Neoehrlichia mikurensis]|uniref:AsmA family protein n=1 Tax=Neoehrlichia mikurensis TaxID=89586 RepID=A0A9Q9F3A8_9RICK|nr:AsmA family protein [Neoehrlichia mikurensis]QXK92223.1 AsmA family protein [Neoehrlichia mikurensis]QXK92678.1 AsmA family protein [Neoehrlichia mikurensis]QXK93916.1 AsmA family protein [Neoehrlichia mikurensis]UTO55082.1 AsmA family protein [Neoehrlichia mikurensis]UTO56001.1 AsmA family protein [Neoehrlichia mikurensis]